MQKNNRKCLACGEEYYFCFKCSHRNSNPQPAWKIDHCDETCKKVFETVSSYNCGSLTKEQALEAIGTIDSVKFAKLKDSLKQKIKELQKADKPAKFSEPFKSEKNTSKKDAEE